MGQPPGFSKKDPERAKFARMGQLVGFFQRVPERVKFVRMSDWAGLLKNSRKGPNLPEGAGQPTKTLTKIGCWVKVAKRISQPFF